MNDFYKDSFEQEMPELKSDEQKKAVKMAILRFVNELRKEIIEIATINTEKTITGQIEITTHPQIVLQKNKYRRNAFVKNIGQIACKVYSVEPETDDGYLLDAGKEIPVSGASAIAVATVSGVSLISYIDS